MTFRLERRDRADLLVDFLSGLLFILKTGYARLVGLSFEELTETRLRVAGSLEPLDVDKCHFDWEVKAVTSHDLTIRQTPSGLETTIIWDI